MKPGGVETIQLGELSVTIVDVYAIPEHLGTLIPAPAAERSPADEAVLASTEELAVQSILVRGPGVSVLVDAGDYEVEFDGAKREGYNPPGVLERLAALGVAPEEIEHVVITHAHGDHYNRLTVKRDGAYQLAFPNARCYLGASDWTSDYCQSELQKADSLDTRTLGVVHGAGRLVPVDGELNLAPNVSILPAPGETPGHQILRVRAGGQTLYCIGDLYHHPIEVIHPTWMSPWGNPTTNVRSRQSVAEAALADNALLVATHIRGVGRLERHDGGVRWVESP